MEKTSSKCSLVTFLVNLSTCNEVGLGVGLLFLGDLDILLGDLLLGLLLLLPTLRGLLDLDDLELAELLDGDLDLLDDEEELLDPLERDLDLEGDFLAAAGEGSLLTGDLERERVLLQ